MTRVLLRDTLWTNALPTGVAIGVDLELGVLFAKGNTLRQLLANNSVRNCTRVSSMNWCISEVATVATLAESRVAKITIRLGIFVAADVALAAGQWCQGIRK